MSFPLTEEQTMLVETVRSFVENELYPHEDLVEQLDDIPPDLAQSIQDKAIALGLYAANMPAEYGGADLDGLSFALLERELGRAGYALHMCVARPSNILRGCKGEQIERYLVPSIKGTRHDCLAMTEPGAGSDVRAMKTRAEKRGDTYVINGSKHFISHADKADFVILFAATGVEENTKSRKAKISSFLVDMGTPGFTMRRGPHCVSHRGYHQCELYFDDCVVHESQLLGEEGKGFDLMNEWLGATRLSVAATSVGRARRVLDTALDWAATRQQFGDKIGRFQGVSFQLADMATEIEAADLLTLSAAHALDQGRAGDQDFAMAKLFASETLARVTDKALQIFGGMGLMNSLPLERWWRDARVERIWDGTSEIQRHIISRAMLRPLGC
ncbi:acyl-CoA dehydrogenase family protein [Methylovirgula sp. 4M-Z18]|uniref:acyl-CoA dehydrogenase family protein n=1 Tax=Methylovirgula sp. 4M-Z18 TaxID=2293567 RepID=UPI000E2F017C|nr:acyl-CoA dehydrogenase family protein [Methylovirgula sp. 4M-Z18]RFB79144.1 acyl-CoA dehydrogenase [Methylovirgula sp. 4M-Z18]